MKYWSRHYIGPPSAVSPLNFTGTPPETLINRTELAAFSDLEILQHIPHVSCILLMLMWPHVRLPQNNPYLLELYWEDFHLKSWDILYVDVTFRSVLEGTQNGQQENSQKLREDIFHSQETFWEGPSRPGAETGRRVRTQEQERGKIESKYF